MRRAARHDGWVADYLTVDGAVDARRKLEAYGAVPISVGSADPIGHDLVINATPMGMRPDDPLPIEVDKLEPTGFMVPPGWYGFVPAAGVGILRQAGVDPVLGPEMRSTGEVMGLDVSFGQPDEVTRIVTAELALWGPLIKSLGLRVE